MKKTGNPAAGKLYVVSTPVGNLEDITLRAIRILNEVHTIVCEDSRQTIKLLNRYEIKKPLISYFHPKEKKKIPLVLNLLKEGRDIALVSDAGTPGISDPGFPLIRKAIHQNIDIIPIPGASALTAALSAAGLPTHRFLFIGFPPPKKQATKKLLESLRNEPSTLVFYLPPRKFESFLSAILNVLGSRQVVIAREITKIHEEYLRGTPDELLQHISPSKRRGEAVVLIAGSKYSP
jgi:16S rRNA (cytidine1402-2'-O)-methyltransferase